nr:hypothetical protein CFP56_63709 [Quercus suber]
MASAGTFDRLSSFRRKSKIDGAGEVSLRVRGFGAGRQLMLVECCMSYRRCLSHPSRSAQQLEHTIPIIQERIQSCRCASDKAMQRP